MQAFLIRSFHYTGIRYLSDRDYRLGGVIPEKTVYFQLVRRCELLYSLNLEWNALGQCELEFSELMSSIGSHRTIHDLDLRNNQLQSSHGQVVAQMLATNPTIKRIDLRWNRIGATAGREILDALK